MANKGLKNYTKQLTQQLGNACGVSVNINEADANLIMTLPLFKTLGRAPIDLSLIYNHQNKDVANPFGKGMRLNLFEKISSSGSNYVFDNCDGSTDIYVNDVFNKETGCKLVKETTTIAGGGSGNGSIGIGGGNGEIITTRTIYKLFDNSYRTASLGKGVNDSLHVFVRMGGHQGQAH